MYIYMYMYTGIPFRAWSGSECASGSPPPSFLRRSPKSIKRYHPEAVR